jgi:hypothetical protein
MRILLTPKTRRRAHREIDVAPDGWWFTPPVESTRSLEQNAFLHVLLALAEKKAMWLGRKHTLKQWKVIFVSAHAVALGEGAEMLRGLEGEYVNLREPTSGMGVKRTSSLIEYIKAWLEQQGINTEERSFEVPGWVRDNAHA